MQKLGHKEGKGLGKYQDGIIEPVEASKQIGKRGLGFKSVELESALLNFDPNKETISIDEEVIWLPNAYKDSISQEVLNSWVKTGYQDNSYNEDLFCQAGVVSNILSSKNVLNNIGEKDLKNSRRRANPFESISKGIFINRAAMKMANLDAILDWMFTNPVDLNGDKIIDDESLLYFADVCAGPGGFSEYVFFRKKWRAKGFGFTLRNENDFMLNEFCAGPSETFDPHYGVRGDGDIYVPENIVSFRDHVLQHTDGNGVHFMMADGGVPIEENFNDQELICKKLYLCQCLVALMIVRTGGHFVVKLFDLFTPFSVGLVYLMYRSFQSVTIIKPNTSRPANSERYLVCKYKREDCIDIANHLFEINKRVPRYEDKKGTDVLELVPIDVLTNDSDFFNYIILSNTKIGKNQIVSLDKLAAFSENCDLKEERQQELRKTCLNKWKIPDEARAEPQKSDPGTKCLELFGNSSLYEFECCSKSMKITTFENFKKNVNSVLDWRFLLINGKEEKNSCGFYMGLGRNNIWEYTSKGWKKLNSSINGFCLPANTIVYGEIVEELIGEGKGQTRNLAFHIIDGLFLGGEDIKNFSLVKRWSLCELFSKALYKKSFPVRVKKTYKLLKFDVMIEDLVYKLNKSSVSESLYFPLEQNLAFKIGGIVFFRDTKEFWHRFYSSTWKAVYFHNSQTNKKIYENHLTDDDKWNIYGKFR
ncbi:conserved hypothetical protein [Pediculus humanus corporis]|uniref:Cap-specific mRNA (nucleoside-2'-O-)-methyltransferase 1 n=1 Tax=Pediculus humanus subsp. corporis TaxID=121224 RepID=E0VR10_PEDHC|nr:uncharacterized protein Phum_PHUM390510 [Pediculus humanus corporis]EEB15816.1 conserved hypothetical protein [Pediculus humanus corporis]